MMGWVVECGWGCGQVEVGLEEVIYRCTMSPVFPIFDRGDPPDDRPEGGGQGPQVECQGEPEKKDQKEKEPSEDISKTKGKDETQDKHDCEGFGCPFVIQEKGTWKVRCMMDQYQPERDEQDRRELMEAIEADNEAIAISMAKTAQEHPKNKQLEMADVISRPIKSTALTTASIQATSHARPLPIHMTM